MSDTVHPDDVWSALKFGIGRDDLADALDSERARHAALVEAARAFYQYHHADYHDCAHDGPDWRDRCPVAALRAALDGEPT